MKGVVMKDVIASLAYDSWTQPKPELRSVPLPDRHLIFEGNGLILDLLLKKQGRGTCLHIGGQVLPGNNPLSAVSDVATRLRAIRTSEILPVHSGGPKDVEPARDQGLLRRRTPS